MCTYTFRERGEDGYDAAVFGFVGIQGRIPGMCLCGMYLVYTICGSSTSGGGKDVGLWALHVWIWWMVKSRHRTDCVSFVISSGGKRRKIDGERVTDGRKLLHSTPIRYSPTATSTNIYCAWRNVAELYLLSPPFQLPHRWTGAIKHKTPTMGFHQQTSTTTEAPAVVANRPAVATRRAELAADSSCLNEGTTTSEG